MSPVSGPGSGRTIGPIVATVTWLAVWNLLRASVAAPARPAAALVVAAGLVLIARWAGLSGSDLGLAVRDLRPGLRLGLIAFAVITAILIVAGLLPPTRGLFDDDRTDVGIGGLLYRVLVAIPIGTVAVEELAFRGSLLALLRRRWSTASAVAGSSVLFGLWHVPPLVDSSIVVILGTLIATTAAGMGFCWLRLRSGSLLAPALAHLALNAVAFTLAWTLAR